MNSAPLFRSIFTPYGQRHIKKGPAYLSLFPEYDELVSWVTVEQPLSDGLISRALGGRGVYGYFLAYSARSFALDIDDHTGKGIGYVLSVYDRVCERLHGLPSLVAKSPQGYHLFYILEHPVPEVLLIARVQQALADAPVEVKPTGTIGLRIPRADGFLDPQTLDPLLESFEALVNGARRYALIELFGDGLRWQVDRKTREARVSASKRWEALARVQGKYAEILPGTTNEALCEVVPIFRSLGFSPEEAAEYFYALLAPRYTGELRDQRRLFQRVRSFYRHEPETRFNATPAGVSVELFTLVIAETIAGRFTRPTETPQQRSALTKQRRTIQRAVIELERWRVYVVSVKGDHRFLEVWNYLYPYFKKNTSEGFFPIPRNILKKLHTDYGKWLMPFLMTVGYLVRSPYPYSSMYGICYYYEMHGERFIGSPAPPPVLKPKSKAQQRAETIRTYKQAHPEATRKEIADLFGVTERTIQNLHLF